MLPLGCDALSGSSHERFLFNFKVIVEFAGLQEVAFTVGSFLYLNFTLLTILDGAQEKRWS